MRRFKYSVFLSLMCICLLSVDCYCIANNRFAGRSDDRKQQNQDTALINRLNTEAFELRRSQPDSAYKLAHNALNLSLAVNYQKGTANAYLALGYVHLTNYTRNDSASDYLNRAYDLFKKIDDNFGMGMAYFGMAYVYSFRGNLQESEKYLKTCLRLFGKLNHKRGLYNVYNSLGYINQQNKDYTAAFDYIQAAIKTAIETEDTALIADANNSLGNIYKDQYLFRQAIDVYFKALSLWEAIDDSVGMAIAYGNIGLMYYYQNDYDKALEYYKKKLPVSVRTKNLWEESKTYNDIGHVYLSVKQYDNALKNFTKGLQLNNQMNYPPGIAESYSNLANTHLMMASYDTAIEYISKSIALGSETSANAKLASFYVLLGKIYLATGRYNPALQNVTKGYRIAKELNIPEVVSEASDLLSRIYSRMHQFDRAYEYLLQYKQMQDSIDKDENIKKITRLEFQYEFDKKQRKIDYEQEQERLAHKAEMRQQKLFLHGTLILSVFMILFVILFIRHKNLQTRLKNIDLEQKLLRVQMNPHFIFNSLCVVQDYILTNKSQEANAFLSRFASLMRAILETSRQDFVILSKEIQALKNYIEIQKLRFETDFEYNFNIDEKIDADSLAVPSMLAQPFIENAIEHGLLPKKEKGLITVSYQLENSLVEIMIEDNGIGRQEAARKKSETGREKQSMATMLTRERISYLKKLTHKKATFVINDIHGDPYPTGTRIIFKVPFKIENK